MAAAEAQMREYKQTYTTLQSDGSEDDLSYVVMTNYGEKVLTNRMNSFFRMRLVQFLSSLQPSLHTVYLTRHGQSEYNVLGKIGGNPPLSKLGEGYSTNLAKFCAEHIQKNAQGQPVRARLWTSSLQRTIHTAEKIPHPPLGEGWIQMLPRVYRNLDEIYAGEYEGLTYKQIEETFAAEADLRKQDKIGYRYPRGESYYDIIARLDPVMHELETHSDPLLIVSHQATLRIVYSYLMGMDRRIAPKQTIPLHTVIKIEYDPWHESHEERFELGPLPNQDDGQTHL